MSKVVILLGSVRKEGNTEKLVEAFSTIFEPIKLQYQSILDFFDSKI